MEDSFAQAIGFLATHGYLVVFLWMFADQAGLPLPGIPLLVAAGALSATGELQLTSVIVLASVATVLADLLWYLLGRRGGAKAVGYVCRLALEPDSCVSTTRTAFGRFGPATLLIAKFLPGVQTLAPASAGLVGAPLLGFLALDAMGTLLFVLPFTLGGYLLLPQLIALYEMLSGVSGGVLLALLAIGAAYGGVKLAQWIAFFRAHRLRRVTPDALKERLDLGHPLQVVDLRQRLDYELQPVVIPGALRIPINEIPKRRLDIREDCDVVLVCT